MTDNVGPSVDALSVLLQAPRGLGNAKSLRRAVGEVVRELRDRGLPPEKVLVLLKSVIAESGIRRNDVLEAAADRLSTSERIVTWAVEEYYSAARG